ncbi:MAG: hypothetical protein WAO19_00325 [Candidatus Kryptoniota bacterium]
MNIRRGQARDSIELVLCALISFLIIGIVTRTDNTITAKRPSFQVLGNTFLPQGQLFDNDEMRIANLFAKDTLPRLMQYGLVKKYELTQSRTILFVDGKMWKQTSQFFKHCLLTEILIHNKVNGYAPETHIVDNQSKRLFAKITPSDRFAFFD